MTSFIPGRGFSNYPLRKGSSWFHEKFAADTVSIYRRSGSPDAIFKYIYMNEKFLFEFLYIQSTIEGDELKALEGDELKALHIEA